MSSKTTPDRKHEIRMKAFDSMQLLKKDGLSRKEVIDRILTNPGYLVQFYMSGIEININHMVEGGK